VRLSPGPRGEQEAEPAVCAHLGLHEFSRFEQGVLLAPDDIQSVVQDRYGVEHAAQSEEARRGRRVGRVLELAGRWGEAVPCPLDLQADRVQAVRYVHWGFDRLAEVCVGPPRSPGASPG
jgi:hypothetical protein